MTRAAACIAAVFAFALVSPPETKPALDRVAANDNRVAAGTLNGKVLTVSLEARDGWWKPDGDDGATSYEVSAFAEAGKPLQVPGPLIRVKAGTEVRATIRNTLARPLTIRGFGAERGLKDSILIAAGASQSVSFVASKPGTFFYVGQTGAQPPFGLRLPGDMSLGGAIVVDSANAPAVPDDRVMVMTWYSTVDGKSPNGLGQTVMAINGLSWPNTERLHYVQGDSIRWRVVNLTDIDHPLHLHGFYFRVTGRGDGATEAPLASAQQLMEVTEDLNPYSTLSIAWKADRSGNWIYHCHYALHLSDLASPDMSNGVIQQGHAAHMDNDSKHQMFGLVMGIQVEPRGAPVAAPAAPRQIRVTMRQRENVYGTDRGYAFVVGGSAADKDPAALPVPAEPLILERGKPVAITIVNRAKESASIHWHGIELESYPDGVPGVSGMGATVLKSIPAGDSLTVRFTPPRAGSFMYHSHINDAAQIGGGAYGPIIVVEPGQKFDPETDRILFFGTAGFAKRPVHGPAPAFLMNGARQPGPMNLKAGQRYRFRLFNLAGDFPITVDLLKGDSAVTWTSVAKDGYAMSAPQRQPKKASVYFTPGEIYDFEYTPQAGDLSLTFGPPPSPPGLPPLPPEFLPPPPRIAVLVRVR
jgi:FtsP/CotA-like multicopper oxidase with cupredoxin domain